MALNQQENSVPTYIKKYSLKQIKLDFTATTIQVK